MTGIPWIIAASALWGVAGGLAGILMERGWEPLVVAFYQAVIGFIYLQPREGLCSNRNQAFWAVLAGAGIAGLERSSLMTWLCLALVLAGVTLLTGVAGAAADDLTAFGIASGIGAGLAYALFIFSFKYAALHGRPHLVLVIVFLTVLMCLVSLHRS